MVFCALVKSPSVQVDMSKISYSCKILSFHLDKENFPCNFPYVITNINMATGHSFWKLPQSLVIVLYLSWNDTSVFVVPHLAPSSSSPITHQYQPPISPDSWRLVCHIVDITPPCTPDTPSALGRRQRLLKGVVLTFRSKLWVDGNPTLSDAIFASQWCIHHKRICSEL